MTVRPRMALAIAAGLVALMLLLGVGERGPGGESGAQTTGSLRTADGRIVRGDGRPVMLRGFNLIPVWSDQPGRTWDAGRYRSIRGAGFNTVRFMLHWDVMEPRRGRLDRVHLRTLDRAVRAARRAGLYVVLNPIGLYQGELHVPAWAREGDAVAAVEQHGEGIVRALARRYRGRDGVAAFDPVNEPPTHPPDQNRILRMYRPLIDAVREEAPGRIVMFEPSFGDSSMVGADLTLLGDTRNLVFSMHDYYAGGAGNGYRATGEVASAAEGARNAAFSGTGYDVPAPAELEQHLLVNLEVMRRAGIPVWIGEFGITGGAANAARWIRDKVALFERHGVGYAWWLYDNKGAFAALHPRSHRFRPFVRALAGR